MKLIFTTLKKILFWSYDRGTWQYDVMCVLILAFVFFAPNSAFQNSNPRVLTQPPARTVYVSTDDLGAIGSMEPRREIEKYLSTKYGYEVTVSSIEPRMDNTGTVRGYVTHIGADRATARD